MRTKLWTLFLFLASAFVTAGCNNPLRLKTQLLPYAPVTSLCGHGGTIRQIIRSEAELCGHDNELVILRGSYVPKLSILGHSNRIVVEPGAAVARVEIAGEDNDFQTAQGMPVILTQFGHGDQFEGHALSPRETARMSVLP